MLDKRGLNLRPLRFFAGAFLSSRAVALGFALLLACTGVQATAQAGCDLGEHDERASVLGDADQDDAWQLAFLGRWVYEAGAVKFEPWRGLPPCQGPGCRSNDRMPATGSTLSNSVRTAPPGSPTPQAAAPEAPTLAGLIALKNLSALSGYPHQHEYPP